MSSALRILSLILLVLPSLPASAAPGGATRQLSVTSAFHDTLTDELTVRGRNFGPDEPAVTLAGLPLDVLAFGDTMLIVDSAAFPPGVHALVVSDGHFAIRVGRLEVTLGAVGPTGPTGPTGPQGARGETAWH